MDIEYSDLSFHGSYVDKRLGPGFGVAFALDDEAKQELNDLFAELVFEKDLLKAWHLRLKGYFDQFELKKNWKIFPEGFAGVYPNGLRGTPELKNRSVGGEMQTNIMIGNHTVTLGSLYEKVSQFDIISHSNFDPNEGPLSGGFQETPKDIIYQKPVTRFIFGLYVQEDWDITDFFKVTYGVRYDKYNDFGNTTNQRGGLIWDFSEKGTVKFLYGEAFRAPNFTELYNQNNPSVLGNDNLSPEKIKTYEMALFYKFSKYLTAELDLYNMKIHDRINFISTSAGQQYDNFGLTKSTGAELEVKFNWSKNLYSYGNYSYQFSRNNETGSILPDVSRHRGNIGVNWSLLKYININTNVFMAGSKRRAEGDSRGDIPAYALVDLSIIGRNFYKKFEITTTINNLLNQKHTDPTSQGSNLSGDFPQPGTEYLVELSYGF